MTPGLAGPPFPPKATKGSTVAIASLSKPSVPVVVGICEIDVSSLQIVQGAKGHAVRGVHFVGDELWSWSTSGSNGRPPPDGILGWDDNLQDQHNAADTMKEPGLEDNDNDEGGVALGQHAPDQRPNDFLQGEDPPLSTKIETEEKSLAVKGGISVNLLRSNSDG